jgi:hypothetical protein
VKVCFDLKRPFVGSGRSEGVSIISASPLETSKLLKSRSKLYAKRQTHRQSGLLQLGQTARLLIANVMLIVMSKLEN